LAVKIGPYFTALPHFAQQLIRAGADGIVLFNRLLEPEIDLERMEVTPHLDLSTAREIRLPLRWLAILRDQVRVSLAATSGIHTAREACQALLAGADVTMMTSALIHNGPDYLAEVSNDLLSWMDGKGLATVGDMRGLSSRHHLVDPSAYERSNYLQALLNAAMKI
jgi:dihydroorotate dehydrogenase (fumarate)